MGTDVKAYAVSVPMTSRSSLGDVALMDRVIQIIDRDRLLGCQPDMVRGRVCLFYILKADAEKAVKALNVNGIKAKILKESALIPAEYLTPEAQQKFMDDIPDEVKEAVTEMDGIVKAAKESEKHQATIASLRRDIGERDAIIRDLMDGLDNERKIRKQMTENRERKEEQMRKEIFNLNRRILELEAQIEHSS